MSKESSHTYTIDIHCQGCQTHLYRYKKEGPGALVKCFVDRILEDNTCGDLCCPSCKQQFARERTLVNRTIHKIIQGKIYVRGHHGR